MTRERAIDLIGQEAVWQAEERDAEIAYEEDGMVRWEAWSDETDDGERVCAVYYQTEEDCRSKAADELDWNIDHYEIF